MKEYHGSSGKLCLPPGVSEKVGSMKEYHGSNGQCLLPGVSVKVICMKEYHGKHLANDGE
eukprot:3786003-Amphidinium_carterae.1